MKTQTSLRGALVGTDTLRGKGLNNVILTRGSALNALGIAGLLAAASEQVS